MSIAFRSPRPAAGLLAALGLLALGAVSAAAAVADHLLLSELVVQTRPTPLIGSKYIELVNPTGAAIDLASVYLTDAIFNSPPTYYYDIVKLGGAGGGGTGGDFHARFPDGAAIAPGDTIAVSILGSAEYLAAFGRLPDYELFEDGTAPDTVPDLVEVFPGSIGRGLGTANTNLPDLASGGESVVLYRWDGLSDLVQDLDYAIWGSVSSVRVDKTGVREDGPDAGADSTGYLPDTAVGGQRPIAASAHNFGNSYQRLSTDEGTEIATGGNGLTGHDETSEQLNATWRASAAFTPPAAPTAFAPPAPIITAATLQPAAPQEGQSPTVSATVVANDGLSGVTIVWSDDGTTWNEVACSNTGGNAWSGQIPARPADTLVRWYLRAIGTGGGQATRPVAAPLYDQRYIVAAAPNPGDYPPALLFTEVCVQGSGQEFVEIWNPTTATVDLSNYYLTDAIFTNEYYWNIVLPNPDINSVGGGNFTDFHARFPDGATVAAGDTLTVSIAGSEAFGTAYGFPPDFELFEDGTGADDVPDMREVFPGSINGVQVPSLSNNGEVVVLYYWNGESDLVTDIDLFYWHTPASTTTAYFFSRQNVSRDGPDADAVATTYQNDSSTGTEQAHAVPTAHAIGESYQRRNASEGSELQTGGNGCLGNDETSEPWNETFMIAPAAPAGPGGGGGEGGGEIALDVPARTFLPLLGESFPVRFRSQRGAQTEVRVFDLTGRLVVTLFDSRFDGAATAVPGQWTRRDWNGRDRQFDLQPAGLYVVQLSVVNSVSGKEETKTAPVVVATRLSK